MRASTLVASLCLILAWTASATAQSYYRKAPSSPCVATQQPCCAGLQAQIKALKNTVAQLNATVAALLNTTSGLKNQVNSSVSDIAALKQKCNNNYIQVDGNKQCLMLGNWTICAGMAQAPDWSAPTDRLEDWMYNNDDQLMINHTSGPVMRLSTGHDRAIIFNDPSLAMRYFGPNLITQQPRPTYFYFNNFGHSGYYPVHDNFECQCNKFNLP